MSVQNEGTVLKSEEQIRSQLEKMVAGLPKELANRRTYCFNCDNFFNDRYAHRVVHKGHKMFGILEINKGLPFSIDGVSAPLKKQSTHVIVVEKTKKALALRDKGFTIPEISKQIGASAGAVHYYLYTIAPSLAKKTKSHHRIVSVLGSDVAVTKEQEVTEQEPFEESQFELGYAAGWVTNWLKTYAANHGVKFSTLKQAVANSLKGA